MRQLIGKLFKTKPTSLFLSAIVVVPRGEWETIDEQNWLGNRKVDFAQHARERLNELFDIPPVPQVDFLNKTDLALEIAVLKIQGGILTDTGTNPYSLPIFWRPTIKLKARLFYPLGGKTHSSYNVQAKTPWIIYFSKLMHIKAFFGISPAFNEADIDSLLAHVGLELIEKIEKSI